MWMYAELAQQDARAGRVQLETIKLMNVKGRLEQQVSCLSSLESPNKDLSFLLSLMGDTESLASILAGARVLCLIDFQFHLATSPTRSSGTFFILYYLFLGNGNSSCFSDPPKPQFLLSHALGWALPMEAQKDQENYNQEKKKSKEGQCPCHLPLTIILEYRASGFWDLCP